jgi:hypothetical protein
VVNVGNERMVEEGKGKRRNARMDENVKMRIGRWENVLVLGSKRVMS